MIGTSPNRAEPWESGKEQSWRHSLLSLYTCASQWSPYFHEHTQSTAGAVSWCNLTQTLTRSFSPEFLHLRCFSCTSYRGGGGKPHQGVMRRAHQLHIWCTVPRKFLFHVCGASYSVAGHRCNLPLNFLPAHPRGNDRHGVSSWEHTNDLQTARI